MIRVVAWFLIAATGLAVAVTAAIIDYAWRTDDF